MGLFKACFGKIDPKVFGINMVEIYINYLVFYQGSGVRSLSQAGATAVSYCLPQTLDEQAQEWGM